jgi:hypothetical protein
MPTTANWSLEYESPSSLPGVTLTGGPAMASPILAVQVDAALTTQSVRMDGIDDDITAINGDISTINNTLTSHQNNITNLTMWTRTGTQNVSFTTQDSFTVASISFGFTFPAAPKVTTNINSAGGNTARWTSRGISATTTTFTLWVTAPTAGLTQTWSSVPVDWVATYRA